MDRYNDVKILLKKWEQSFFQTNNRKPNKVSGSDVYWCCGFILCYDICGFLVLCFILLLCCMVSLMFFNIVLFTDICLLLWVWLTSVYVITNVQTYLFFWRMTLIKLQRRLYVSLFCCVNFVHVELSYFVLIFDLYVLVFAELYKEYRSLKEAKERKSSEQEDQTKPPESHSSTAVRRKIYFIWTFISRLYSFWRS